MISSRKQRLIQLALENSRTLLSNQVSIRPITGIDALLHPEQTYQCTIASIEAASQTQEIAGVKVVLIDSTQTHWIAALLTALEWGGRWPLYILEQYYILRLNMAGLGAEADIFNQFIAESRTALVPLPPVDAAQAFATNGFIESLILGHELGHLAFSAASTIDSALLKTVRSSCSEIERVFAAALDYKMEELDLSSEEEDELFRSVEEYLDRYLFAEFPEDTRSIQHEVLRKADVWGMMQRVRRLEPLRAAFGGLDLLQESFCDIYGFERFLQVTGNAAHIHDSCLRVWRILHCLFAFGAIDSLVQERTVKAQMRGELRALYAPLTAEAVEAMGEAKVEAITAKADAIRARHGEDPLALAFQTAMVRAIFRRVAFYNYFSGRPEAAWPTTVSEMHRLGEELEAKLLGACARIRAAADLLEPQLPKLLKIDSVPLSEGELREGWRSLSTTLPRVGFIEMLLSPAL